MSALLIVPRTREVPWRGTAEVARQSLADLRRAVLGWSVGLAGLATLYVSLWPSLQAQPAITAVYAELPAALRTFLAAAGDPSTAAGYTQLEVFSLTGPVLLTVMAVTLGAALLAGAEDRGALAAQLVTPVGRPAVVVGRAWALLAALAAPAACLAGVLLLAGPLLGLHVRVVGVLGAVLHLWLLAAVIGCLTLALGAATGRPGTARGVAAAVAVLAYAVDGLAPLVSWLGPLQRMSPFHDTTAPHALLLGPSGAHAALAAAEVVLLVAVAVAALGRRDLR